MPVFVGVSGTPKAINAMTIGVGGANKSVIAGWVGVAGNIPKLFYAALRGIIAPTSVNESFRLSGNIFTDEATVTVLNGTVSSSAWRRVSGDANITASSPASLATRFQANGATVGGATVQAVFVCDLTGGGVTVETENTVTVTIDGSAV